MQHYCLGFMFDLECENVALIRKTKPAWQQGKLNGIGGKVEPGESFLDAMIREFCEETGVHWQAWTHRCTLHRDDGLDSPGFKMHVFSTFSSQLSEVTTTTEEEVIIHPLATPLDQALDNLKWLIPFCLDRGPDFADVRYCD